MRRMYSKQQLEEIAKDSIEHSELNFLEDIAFAGDVSIGGDASVAGDLSVTGDASVGGDLSVTGDASIGGDLPVVGKITGGEIIESMSGYSMTAPEVTNLTKNNLFGGIVKNGNKLTCVYAGKLTRTGTISSGGNSPIARMNIPSSIGEKLYVVIGSLTLARDKFLFSSMVSSSNDVEIPVSVFKESNSYIGFFIGDTVLNTSLTANEEYYVRIEVTFLLSDNLLA